MWKVKTKTASRSAAIRMRFYHRTGYATEVYTLGNVSCDNYNVGYSDARGNTWYFYYNGIKKTNQLLERIDDVPATSNDDIEKKEQITGQAYFLRAFFYHQLYSLYGRIPLVYHTFDMKCRMDGNTCRYG